MTNPTNDPRVDLARSILDESKRLHTQGCSRRDLLYYLGRVQDAARMLLEFVDEVINTPRETRVPDIDGGGHTFVRGDGDIYTCERCGRESTQTDVYYVSVFEVCPRGGEDQ